MFCHVVFRRAACACVRAKRFNLPSLFSPSLSPLLSPPPLPSPSSPSLHLRKRGASRQPAIETLRGKSHRAAIISPYAWGAKALERNAICAPRAASRPAAANYKATHLRNRRESRGRSAQATPLFQNASGFETEAQTGGACCYTCPPAGCPSKVRNKPESPPGRAGLFENFCESRLFRCCFA